MVVSKRKKKRKTKKNDAPLVYLVTLLLVALLAVGLFQLGLIGTGIDSMMSYIAGSARYFTYLWLALLIIYFAVYKKHVPLSRRMVGWGVLQIGLCLFLAVIAAMLHMNMPSFNRIFELESGRGMHFYGGGIIGAALESLFSALFSLFGSSVIAILLLGISGILISGRSIRKEAGIIFNSIHIQIEKMRIYLKAKRKMREDSASKSKQQEQQEVIIQKADTDEEEQVTHEEVPIIAREPKKQESTAKQKNEQKQPVAQQEFQQNDETRSNYKLPPLSLLKTNDSNANVDAKSIREKGRLLEATLKNFGVNAKVSQIRIGPAVTQYEVQPAMGVKVSRIVNLSNDIALALAAKDIRIEAPIPGKSAVGIEVPNRSIAMVSLKEVMEEAELSNNPLKVVLGRNISGEPISAELNKMPHLLVAGSTGSGKSVCINGIITSILMNAKPHEVKMMMIDPKMVELNVYNGIPHLLTPVVTNPQKASQALQKIVGEMERRYDLFSHTGTKNIEGYNHYLTRQNQELGESNALLPYIVVIVDELADLMMVASKDVENAIMRLAQMARAAGIHLIIATQRPSVDVITGLIKANIPSRIAFAVSSQVDSRTILDSSGAEKLLGRGDMLFLPSGESKPVRVQGAYLSEDEVEAVVHYVTSQQRANYDKEMEPGEVVQGESEDELYDAAFEFVVQGQKASASLLQRQFRIGYNRAARLIDELEANQVIGPALGSKPRQVLIEKTEEA